MHYFWLLISSDAQYRKTSKVANIGSSRPQKTHTLPISVWSYIMRWGIIPSIKEVCKLVPIFKYHTLIYKYQENVDLNLTPPLPRILTFYWKFECHIATISYTWYRRLDIKLVSFVLRLNRPANHAIYLTINLSVALNQAPSTKKMSVALQCAAMKKLQEPKSAFTVPAVRFPRFYCFFPGKN